MSYIRNKPKEATFSLPFSDNSGERLKVMIYGKMTDVSIGDVGSSILVSVEDIQWLRQTLDDVLQITKMEDEK